MQVNHRVREDLRRICIGHPRHEFRLERVAAYPGGCVYMPPEPASALLDLMHDIWRNWPTYLPYEGQYGEVMPHVTLAIVEDHAEAISRVAAFAEPYLPLRVEARELQLLSIRDGKFELMCSFPLAT
jgi:2'-5' RNA ligase